MGNQLHLTTRQVEFRVSGFDWPAQPDQVLKRQLVAAPQIDVAVLGGETIKMRTADGDELDAGQVCPSQVSQFVQFQRHRPFSGEHEPESG